MSRNNLALVLVVAALGIVFGSRYFSVRNAEMIANQNDVETPTLSVETTSHDWGEIPIDGGILSYVFRLENRGPGDLELRNVSTSCRCTTARVEIAGEQSPFFGMHAQSNWIGTVPSGAFALLEVEFDPAFHGEDGVGEFTRQVNVATNDLSRPQLVFDLTGEVTQ